MPLLDYLIRHLLLR